MTYCLRPTIGTYSGTSRQHCIGLPGKAYKVLFATEDYIDVRFKRRSKYTDLLVLPLTMGQNMPWHQPDGFHFYRRKEVSGL